MRHIPVPQEVYRHFKGNLYQIVTVAEHSETGEELVIYQALYGNFKVYARPLASFMEKADKEKYPDAMQEYRFEWMHGKETQQEGYANNRENELEKEGVMEEGEIQLEPLVIEFLDASGYGERLNILSALHHKITDDMINIMSMALDIEVKPGDIEERYAEFRGCLALMEKYECNRLR